MERFSFMFRGPRTSIRIILRFICCGLFLSACNPFKDAGIKAGVPPSITMPDDHPPGYYMDDPLPDRTAYLTFDDGPADWTGDILTILKDEDVKATFFICGNWEYYAGGPKDDFLKYRDVLVRMAREGHVIGNHTLNHYNLANLGPEKIGPELDGNQDIFNGATGLDYRMTLMRPPHGSPWRQPSPADVCARVGREVRRKAVVCMWTRHFDSGDSMGWVRGEWYEKGPRIYEGGEEFRDKMRRIYNRLMERADGRGLVILMHDTHPTTRDILPAVIDNLKKRGYRFATMEEYVRWRWGMASADIVDAARRREGLL